MTNLEHPSLTTSELAHLALRYAANDLAAPDLHAFEARLCDDQTAREALAEAIRLSAAASGLVTPAPVSTLARDIADQLHPTWLSRLLPRKRYRGHPALWATAGALAVGSVSLTVWALATPSDVDLVQQLTPDVVRRVRPPEILPESVVATRRENTELPLSKLNPMGWHEKHPNAEQALPMASGRMTERANATPITKPTNKPDVAGSDLPSNETQPTPMTESATKKL